MVAPACRRRFRRRSPISSASEAKNRTRTLIAVGATGGEADGTGLVLAMIRAYQRQLNRWV